jgi:DNA invertase Pin-like site-specific DNA recombinase
MTKKAALYGRVSSEEQAKGDAVSLDSQLADMRALCERNGWQVHSTFVDCENYRATQTPKRGKVVNPSGERADRPQFLSMLEAVRGGDVDVVLCWRDDRLMRHPRVAVALEDALDVGDVRRNGRGKIAVHDATGGTIDRFVLNIKAVIWREENKRRVERSRMGKEGVLRAGRWPGPYNRLGYTTVSEPGRRGLEIVLGGPAAVLLVQNIFNWYDGGMSARGIRKRLIQLGAEQVRGDYQRKHEWSEAVILKILRAEDYTGRCAWRFADGEVAIKIPAIIEREQWERVQKKLDAGRFLSPRNTKHVYPLKGLLECGECGGAVSVTRADYIYKKQPDGTWSKKTKKKAGYYYYRCVRGYAHPTEPHPTPKFWSGQALDDAVWSYLVEHAIKRPDLIMEQIINRQKELLEQGNGANSEIARARQKLEGIAQERAFYQRQAAKGHVSELEFEQRMAETKEAATYWQSEAERLTELRDNATALRAGLDYVEVLLNTFNARLGELDVSTDELKQMPPEDRDAVLSERRSIIHALCDRVTVYADKGVEISGLLGENSKQFVIPTNWIRRQKTRAG